MVRIRSVRHELEAKLAPVPGSESITAGTTYAKAEWKVYGDGTRRCKLTVSRLDLPDGAVIELGVDGRQIDIIAVQGRRARFERESERGEIVPDVSAGQMLQVSYAGEVLLAGAFYEE
jgi:hypothetical protein